MAPQFLLLDVDNTLYARSHGVVDLVDGLINRYLAERVGIPQHEVDEARRGLWSEYGTTLYGLMHRTGIDPDDYLRFVHDIDHAALLRPDPALAAMLARIPLLKVAVTNGSLEHAQAVLDCLGVRHLFFRLFALERLHYVPKPYVHAYQTVLTDLHARGGDCVLVEDSAKNLRTARQLGIRTVHVADGTPAAAEADVSIASILELEAALAQLA